MPLTVLVTSPRVAPGLLTWAAWQKITTADAVLCSSDDLPVGRAVKAAGFAVGRADAVVPSLLRRARDESVVWLASDEEAETLTRGIASALVGASVDLPEVEVLHASYDVPGGRLLDLVTVMDRLRRECPWDQEQTHRSLARYLVEEAYETLEAIDTGDLDHLREELGDLLLQVLFHARIAAELGEEGFTIDDVAEGIVAKLVYRHPHVFAGLDVAGADEVNANWEKLKAAEKQRSGPLDGVPLALPGLALADKVLGRLAKAGRPVDLGGAGGAGDVGAELLVLVQRARERGIDAEQALRDAVRRLL